LAGRRTTPDIGLAEGQQLLDGRRTPDIRLAEEGHNVSASRRMSGSGLVEERQVIELAEGSQILVWQKKYAKYRLPEGCQIVD
jgi:hypothetical protein